MIFFGSDISNSANAPRGRLAPSPTGLLHLGNAWAFWAAWLDARSTGGEIVLRFEDIDPARSRAEYAQSAIRDLAWLGLDWDFGPPGRVEGRAPDNIAYFQSERQTVYREVLSFLQAGGLVYPCYCTRKELRDIAGAPHVDDAGAPYPGTCKNLPADRRKAHEEAGRRASLRLACPPETLWTFEDAVMGRQSLTLAECGGDFALRRSDGVFAYQLAVVADDIAMGVTRVVRGSDILPSTPRQMYVYSLLNVPCPQYAHVPLVVDEQGERLAKRHASLTLRSLREAGVLPRTILGWLAAAFGLRENYAPLEAREAVTSFGLEKIRPERLRLPPDPTAYFLGLQR